MGTITSPRREDSTTGYTAQIRIMRDCAQVYQVSQAFDRKQAAQPGQSHEAEKANMRGVNTPWGNAEKVVIPA